MPAFLFLQIGLWALGYGLANLIPAVLMQKEAEEINMRAYELIRGTSGEYEKPKKNFVLELVQAALRSGVLSGLLMGVFVAVAVYDMAGVMAAAGRRMWAGFADRIAKQYTISAILGNGSPLMGAAVLGSIVLGMICAEVGACARKRARENRENAYKNLLEAQRIRWERGQMIDEF